MARLAGASVKVAGLDELRRELKKLDDKGLTERLKDANYAVASTVVERAKSMVSTRMQASAAQSLKAARQAARAQVSGGGASKPFFGGAEFGSIRYRQFEPWRGSGTGAGYFLYPAIRASIDDILETYGDAIEKLAAEAFPD